MLKRSLLIAAFLLSACGGAEAPSSVATEKPADNFLTKLQADYPTTLSKIAENVWVHTTNYKLPGQNPIGSNGLVVVDGDDVILVDGAWGELATLSLLEKVKAETGKAVTKMVVTHHHMDRTAGVDVAEWQGIQVFSHPDTPALAAKNGFPVPNTSVAGLKNPKSRTKVGSIEVAYPGHGHALQWVKATYPKTKTVVPGHGKGANLSLIDATLALINAEASEADEAP